MNNNKKILILSSIIVLIVVVLLIGASFAFFGAQSDKAKSVDVNVNASKVDEFKFSTGGAISLSASQDNFVTGGGSLTSKTTATASLTANTNTNAATEHY